MKNPSSTVLGELQFSMSDYGVDLYPTVLNSRIYTAMKESRSSYKVFRKLTFVIYSELESFVDKLATTLGWNVHRLSVGAMLMDAEGLFVKAEGFRKSNYCTFDFRIWAESVELAEDAKKEILFIAENAEIHSPIVSIRWSFINSKSEVQNAYMEEIIDDVIYDEAYPALEHGVSRFISDYLDSAEPILVLQGNPGTGKTKLIRSVLGAIAVRNKKKTGVLYTGDKKAMETDEIFVNFITGDEDVFIIEDADYVLQPRSDGNENLHRFLTIADGVVRSQGRKIIFSTNLPNLGDIDDALIRPGRCFARAIIREHTEVEAKKLLERLCNGDVSEAKYICDQLLVIKKKNYSLAEIYRAFGQRRTENGV